jgi:hypothetical protein
MGKMRFSIGKASLVVFCVVDFSELKCPEQVNFSIKIKTLFIDGENAIQHRESKFGGFFVLSIFPN